MIDAKKLTRQLYHHPNQQHALGGHALPSSYSQKSYFVDETIQVQFATEEQIGARLESNEVLEINAPDLKVPIEELRTKKKNEVRFEKVPAKPNQWQVFEVGMEFQSHRKQMSGFSFAVCCLCLLEVRSLQNHGVVMDCLDGGIAAQVSRQPAWHPQACGGGPQAL